jgi:hypothetical protein
MTIITNEDKAAAISQLAEQGLSAVTDTYVALVTETFHQYTNVNAVIKQYKSITNAMSALTNAMIMVSQDPNNAVRGVPTITELYPEKLGPSMEKVTNIARNMLIKLMQLAGKYKRLAVYATLYQRNLSTITDMKTKLTEIQLMYDNVMQWEAIYPKQFESLKKNNKIASIAQLVSSIERSTKEEGTKLIGK